MKHRGSFPHRMDAPDRHNGQKTNERTYGRRDASLCPSVRLLHGVWHSRWHLLILLMTLKLVCVHRQNTRCYFDPGFPSTINGSQVYFSIWFSIFLSCPTFSGKSRVPTRPCQMRVLPYHHAAVMVPCARAVTVCKRIERGEKDVQQCEMG